MERKKAISATPIQENHSTRKRPSLPHIIPAQAALSILVGAIICFDRYASAMEDKYIHALAAKELPQGLTGSVLQQAAFRQPDLLTIYGSSEMLSEPSASQQPSNLFASFPTGFAIYNISKTGENPLDIAQALAAIGPELRNKKVVISFTPGLFDRLESVDNEYSGNFSRMHAYALVFSPNLSMTLKQRFANRMLDYPGTFRHDMVLTLAVRNLANGGLASRLKYALIYPLGQLEALTIRMQDHFSVWNYIQTHPGINPVTQYRFQSIDWAAQLAQADAEQQSASSNNPFGVENNIWIKEYHQKVESNAIGSIDQKYLTLIEESKEWGDLELMLDVCREEGAKPLILGRPINGLLSKVAGISPEAQQVYYTKLEEIASNYHYPLADFKDHTNDRFFSIDEASHTSRKGWVLIDQVLDAFYHGILR